MHSGDPFGLVGQVLDGQFRVDKFVGEGGFSIVYRGHHVGLDEPIAIKCLKLPAALGSALVESFVRRFRDESRLHYRLSQGNLSIARSIASGTTMAPATSALVPYMVLEWLEGRSMAQDFEVRRAEGAKGRSLDEVVRLLDPAAQALAYAHAQGVVHRDINPGNLFLAKTREGQVMKVLDFGVAKIVSDHALEMGPRAQTIGQIRIFAPAYGAPEQFDDAMGKVGPQTDVYSFAMIALESLRDKPVREGEHLGEFALKALDADLPTPRRLGIPVGDEVEQAFARAVALKAAERPADVGEFWGLLKHAMRADAASGRPPYAHPTSPDGERWRPMPPAAGAGAGRPITADMPAPVVEVTRPGGVAPPADTRGNPGARQMHMTVRMPSAPPKPGAPAEGSGAYALQPQTGAAALAGTPPLKSTLVMGNNPYGANPVNTPLPPTTRTGQMPHVPAMAPPPGFESPLNAPSASPYAHSQQVVESYSGPAPMPMNPHGSTPPPGGAYGPPPMGAYGPAPSLHSVPPAGRADVPTVVPPPQSRGPMVAVVVVVVVVLIAAAAFGAYRMMARRADTTPPSAPVATATASPTGPSQGAAQSAAPITAQGAAPSAAIAASNVAANAEDASVPEATTAAAVASPTTASPTTPSTPSRTASASRTTPATPAAPLPLVPQNANALVAPADPKAFNPVTAKAALDLVDGILASCRHPNGIRGDGLITVTFANDGTVSHAVVDEPPFTGTPEGQCVQSRFRHARTTPFEGPPGTIVYAFHVPK